MKKILSLVLVIAMMASLVVFAAPAASADETGFTVEITNATAQAGDKVTLDVIVTGTTMYAYALAFEYDATRLANPVITPDSTKFAAGGKVAGADYQASHTSNVTAGAFDVSGGYTIATITFDVVEGAEAGDAYVKCAPFKNDTNIFLAPSNDYKESVYDWNVIEGAVTVLNDGVYYGVDESAFTTTTNATGLTITGYTGNGGVVIIPSTIGGVAVTEIGSHAFMTSNGTTPINNTTVTKVVVPDSVTAIADYAFVNCKALTDVYINGASTTIGTCAIGCAASASISATVSGRPPVTTYTWSFSGAYIDYVDDGVNYPNLTTIHGLANSEVATYAATPLDGYYYTWEAIDACNTVTFVTDETSVSGFAYGASATVPSDVVVDGKPVVAWKANGAAVLPGAAVAINGDTTFEAMTVDMATENGAAVKITEKAEELALRFTATINIADYEAIVDAFEGATISHGMLIVPQQYVARAGGFTHAALENLGKGYLDFEMSGCYEMTSTDYVLAASIKGFSDTTRAKNPKFNAVGYIAITIGEETTYVYSNYNTATARDAKSVLANTTVSGDAATWISDLLKTFA